MIVITGASDGIGAALARRLSKEYELVLFGRDEERLKAVASECGDCQYFAFDLNDTTARNSVVEQLQDVDVLINNAGVWHKVGELDMLSEEKIVEVLHTNLVSQVLLTHALLPKMKNRDNAAIINVVSKSGVVAQKGQSVYTASKYGMRGFTEVLQEDCKDFPIRIAGVYQSGTDTDMFKKAGETFSTEDFTKPEDLAEVVAFMLSRPKSLWIKDIRIER